MKLDDTRRRLATGWDPHVCTARDYARSVGVSERALRLWRAKFLVQQPTTMPPRQVFVPPAHTLDVLDARLLEADAAVDAARAAIAACRAALDAAAAPPASSGIRSRVESREPGQVVPVRCQSGGEVDVNATKAASVGDEPTGAPPLAQPHAAENAPQVARAGCRGAFVWDDLT